MPSFVRHHSLNGVHHAGTKVLAVLYIYFFIASTKTLALRICLSAPFLLRISHIFFHRVKVWTVSGPLQRWDLCHLQIILHLFGTLALRAIVHEYLAFMNVGVNIQHLFEQFYMFFTCHGGTFGQKVQSSCARIAHCT